MPKKHLTASEKRYFAKVAALGCYVGVHFPEVNAKAEPDCKGYVNIHHAKLLGKTKSHERVIPLCTSHHVQWTLLGFGYSVHNGTKTFEERYGTQEEMLQWVAEQFI